MSKSPVRFRQTCEEYRNVVPCEDCSQVFPLPMHAQAVSHCPTAISENPDTPARTERQDPHAGRILAEWNFISGKHLQQVTSLCKLGTHPT